MNRVMKAVPFVVLCALIIAVTPVWALWIPDGGPICTAEQSQEYPTIASDGAGGAIITWMDWRAYPICYTYAQRVDNTGIIRWTAGGISLGGGVEYPVIVSDGAGGAIVAWAADRWEGPYYTNDILAQRLDASGNILWTSGGVPICVASEDQYKAMITSDGAGGAIIAWVDTRGGGGLGNGDIYAQKVNGSGIVQWTTNGVAICTAAGDQTYPEIISDGLGGAIVTWDDNRSGSDIYAQKVNSSGVVQWTANGLPLCTATSSQDFPVIAPDGSGGAIVAWYDYRSGNYDIYAQRVNGSGTVQWTANGIPLCTEAGSQGHQTVVYDNAGGAIVAWRDSRGGTSNQVYAQRVNASGAVQWTANGIALSTTNGSNSYPQIISNEAGEAIITWRNYRDGTNYNIYAQRVGASGVVQWTAGGVALSGATAVQNHPMITSGSSGGAIVTWDDDRSGNKDIYAQFVTADGRIGVLAPCIHSVLDVPGDQGGWVRVSINRSRLDDELETAYPVSAYNVWQRIDDPTFLADIAHGNNNAVSVALISEASESRSIDESSFFGLPVMKASGRYFVQSGNLLGTGTFPAGTWELLGSFAAYQEDQYIYRASTLADSTEGGIPYSVYIVSAHTTTPSVWFMSAPDSGYSVDNIPPEKPGGLVAEQKCTPAGLELSWNVNVETDLSCYAVYRGMSADFVPTPENRVATPTVPEYLDVSWRWSSGFYYKVSAVDVHGNESCFALLAPDGVTGTDTPKAPEATYLAQNQPNPFNPTTRIAFGLSAPAHVSLRIYDVAGRLVRVLAEGARPAGNYSELWDGRDSGGRAVASGIYFYRLQAGPFSETKKMALLR
jgi:hypothetical protein